MFKNKDFTIYFVLVMTIFSLMSINSFADENIEAIVLGDEVNIRSNPSVESDVIGNILLGDKVFIISSDDNWYNIKDSNGLIGWVLNDLIIPKNIQNDLIKKGKVLAENLNARETPSLDSKILISIPQNSLVSIINSKDEWYNIVLSSSQDAWVHSSLIELMPNYSLGKITGSDVNFRSLPSTDSDVIDKLYTNHNIMIKSYLDGWYEIIDESNRTGWVYKDFITLSIKPNDYIVSRSSDRTAFKLIETAKSLLGKPYVYGSAGPSSFDCSGFTYYVYKQSGLTLSRTSHSQAGEGTLIDKSMLKTGDLVFFDTSGKYDGNITHVGIYIENGEFIHASSGRNAKKVVISNLNEGYYNEKYVKGKRIL